MKLFNIENIPSFMNCVRECEGEIAFEDNNGELHDLKALANSFKGIENTINGGRLNSLTIHVSHPDDQYRIISYMAETALAG